MLISKETAQVIALLDLPIEVIEAVIGFHEQARACGLDTAKLIKAARETLNDATPDDSAELWAKRAVKVYQAAS